MRRVPTDFAEYHRRRWRARLLTLPYALAGGYLAYAVVRALTGSEGINPFGLIPFLLLLALAASARRTLGHVPERAPGRRCQGEQEEKRDEPEGVDPFAAGQRANHSVGKVAAGEGVRQGQQPGAPSPAVVLREIRRYPAHC